MNLVLIGYRGTGKSSVASLLGERLGRRVVSLDQRLVLRAGQPIPEFVAEHGWHAFRDLEAELCAEHARQDGLVLDCGGASWSGQPTSRRCARTVAWCGSGRRYPPSWSESATAPSAPRSPAREFVDEVAEVLGRRTPLYRAAAISRWSPTVVD